MARTSLRPSLGDTLVMLGVSVGLAGGFTGVYFSTFSVFLKPIAADFGWDRTAVSSAIGIAMVGAGLSGIVFGRLIDRYGPLKVIGASIAGLAVMLLVCSTLPNDHRVFALVSFFTGFLGAATNSGAYLVNLARRFDRRLGLTLALASGGQALGGALFPLMAFALISRFGWRHAYQGLALSGLVIGYLACSLIYMGRVSPAAAVRPGNNAPGTGLRFAKALRDARLWVLIAVTLVLTTATMGTVIHLPALATDRGYTPLQGVTLLAIGGSTTTVARMAGGVLLDFVSARLIAAVTFVCGAVAFLLYAVAQSYGQMVAASVLFGVMAGAEGDLLPFFVRRYFGILSFGSIYGVIYGMFAAGTVIGSIGFAVAFDRIGSYVLVMQLSAGCALGCAVACLLLGRYRY